MAQLGDTVHYICTDTHKCQAAIVTGGEGTTLTLHVMRPINEQPVERLENIPFSDVGHHTPGTWHPTRTHQDAVERVA